MRTSTLALGLALVAGFGLAQKMVAPIRSTPGALKAEGKKFDGKLVQASGTVSHFKAKTSKAGNPYFTFDLSDAKGKVEVYGRGKLKVMVKDGSKVQATGTFVLKKEMKSFTIENEIDVTGKGSAEPGVKLVK